MSSCRAKIRGLFEAQAALDMTVAAVGRNWSSTGPAPDDWLSGAQAAQGALRLLESAASQPPRLAS